jgi:hypothetical protein
LAQQELLVLELVAVLLHFLAKPVISVIVQPLVFHDTLPSWKSEFVLAAQQLVWLVVIQNQIWKVNVFFFRSNPIRPMNFDTFIL